MDISTSEYRIVALEDKYAIKIDGDLLKTPKGSVVAHDSYRLLQHIILDLEGFKNLDPLQFSYYGLFSSYRDFFEGSDAKMSQDEFRRYILRDGVLQACAGPERTSQFRKWGALFQVLEERSLEYPDLIQVPDPALVEEWIASCGPNYAKAVDGLVSHFCEEFNLLSKQQQAGVINCAHVHGSMIYGIMLCSKKCNELEYATAILAGQCLLPNVFDIEIDDYREISQKIILDANIVSNFIDFTLRPDYHTINMLREKLPNYAFLPEASRFALIEALNRIHDAKSDDYSSYVVLLGKAMEVSLKGNVFDPFQERFNARFVEQRETRLSIEENGKLQNFTKYLVREPHFIELGSMLKTLGFFNDRSLRNDSILSQFFQFVHQELHKPDITRREWLNTAWALAKARNEAAHSKRFSLTEAQEVSHLALNLLALT